jgi:hypothetical protein
MKTVILFLILTVPVTDLLPQNDSELRFIFVPHPRSEDQVNQSVYAGIETIDFTKYDVTMLGGDLTYSSSADSTTLAYCDNLFNLGSPNTLWSFGNHDIQSGHRTLIKEFTGRESFYSYARDGVAFIVLDTELDANGFSNTFIRGGQLQMVKDVCDSISESRFLILLHHRFMWMINNDYFKSRLTDSIAASSRSLDTTNFYSDIYPLLQKVKSKGIEVLVFGGDKSKINISYSPEDSITFYAARLAADLPDSINNVIVINYNKQKKEINCNFTPLSEMITSAKQEPFQSPERFTLNQNYPNPFNPITTINFAIPTTLFTTLKVFDILGREVATLFKGELTAGKYSKIWDAKNLSSGIYFYTLRSGKFTETRKLLLQK